MIFIFYLIIGLIYISIGVFDLRRYSGKIIIRSYDYFTNRDSVIAGLEFIILGAVVEGVVFILTL